MAYKWLQATLVARMYQEKPAQQELPDGQQWLLGLLQNEGQALLYSLQILYHKYTENRFDLCGYDTHSPLLTNDFLMQTMESLTFLSLDLVLRIWLRVSLILMLKPPFVYLHAPCPHPQECV